MSINELVQADASGVKPSDQFKPSFFSARGDVHASSGDPDVLTYSWLYCDAGDDWDGTSTFTAPENGYYKFDFGFVRDSEPGTTMQGDVLMYLALVGIGYFAYALAGYNLGGRTTGACSVILYLQAGQRVQTKLGSAEGKPRTIANYYLTGMRIG